jgi:putative oxidoreductase
MRGIIVNLFKPAPLPLRAASGVVVLRLVAGLAFMFHGWGKIQDPFGWMGEGAAIPGFFQMLAAVAEFFGGLAWILGALTPLASLGLTCTMSVAVWFHAVKLGDPFVAKGPGGGSYELAAVYLCVSLLLLLAGPGRFSLDRLLFGRKS